MLEKMFERLNEIYPELVEIRRDLHMYPELSYQEVHTPKKIADYLMNLGIEVETGIGGRGVVGKLRGGKPGKTIAFRADFDALPIQDEKTVSYKSRVPGVMHACGHDIHTAALLGTAKVLSEVKDRLVGDIVFIHQFAEEVSPGGAQAMIADGCLEGVDSIFGAHVFSFEPFGTIGIRAGTMMAAIDGFHIEISGFGGHGSQPHQTVDSLVIGCQLVLNLQQIVSRRIDPLQPAVVTVGSFESGKASNVIANSAKISGTVRSFDPGVRDCIENAIKQIAKSTCEGAGAEVHIQYERGYPPVINHLDETRHIEEWAKSVVGEEHVIQRKLGMGSEDFAYYLQHRPGAFFSVGGGNPEMAAIYPNHHPKFDVDERSMINISKMFLSAACHHSTSSLQAH
ncbi:M20 metallopeptidase family protein [Bacillus sp. 1P06AnD]|uniref:M20 metallopeptidase family protein n=1 Tax=Bacillus sp. 1P06AnD TaxID=3132208 RepID=UPI0039A17893